MLCSTEVARQTKTTAFIPYPPITSSATHRMLGGLGSLFHVSLHPSHPTPVDHGRRQRFPDTQIVRLVDPKLYDQCCCNWRLKLRQYDGYFTVSRHSFCASTRSSVKLGNASTFGVHFWILSQKNPPSESGLAVLRMS